MLPISYKIVFDDLVLLNKFPSGFTAIIDFQKIEIEILKSDYLTKSFLRGMPDKRVLKTTFSLLLSSKIFHSLLGTNY